MYIDEMALSEKRRQEREDRRRRIMLAITHAGFTYRRAAESAGIDEQVITDIVTDRRPGMPSLPKLARALSVPLEWILNGENPPKWTTSPIAAMGDATAAIRDGKDYGRIIGSGILSMRMKLPNGLTLRQHMLLLRILNEKITREARKKRGSRVDDVAAILKVIESSVGGESFYRELRKELHDSQKESQTLMDRLDEIDKAESHEGLKSAP